MERLDKILANAKLGSRKEVRQLIKSGRIQVDGAFIQDPAASFDPETSRFLLDQAEVDTRKFIYLMLNKPDGYLSATEDARDPVVLDLIASQHRAFAPFPVGRLDKDTTGLLLLTNDGSLNHQLISPRWHIDKIYVARLRDPALDSYHRRFEQGVVIDDGYRCLPARMEVLSEDARLVRLTIQEGKFHQVKRMFEALDNRVQQLKRVAFGPLTLPEDLSPGQYRELTAEELSQLMAATRKKGQPMSFGATEAGDTVYDEENEPFGRSITE